MGDFVGLLMKLCAFNSGERLLVVPCEGDGDGDGDGDSDVGDGDGEGDWDGDGDGDGIGVCNGLILGCVLFA